MAQAGKRWRRLHCAEDLALAGLLALLVLLAVLQIVLRTVFDTGLLWLDPLLRALVLWVAMLGAMVAAREGRHIGLDLVGRVLPPVPARIARLLSWGFAAAVSGLLAWQAGRMVVDERAMGTIAFAAVPVWWVQAILPFAFAVIALRLAIGAVLPPSAAAAGEALATAPEAGGGTAAAGGPGGAP